MVEEIVVNVIMWVAIIGGIQLAFWMGASS
jgi:hypothetical protein